MNRQNTHEDLRKVEGKAEELVSLTLEVCEKRLTDSCELSPEHVALSSAAMSVRQSVKTFLAVTSIPGAAKDDADG